MLNYKEMKRQWFSTGNASGDRFYSFFSNYKLDIFYKYKYLYII